MEDAGNSDDAGIPELMICSDIDLNDSQSGSDGWSDAEEAECEPLTCLFCPQSFKTTVEAVTHSSREHNLAKIKNRFNMDCYGFIKLVNFVRIHHAEPDFLLNCKDPPPWEKEEFLTPVKEDDPWLMVDIDDIDSIPDLTRKPANSFHCVNAEDGLVTLSEQHFSDLQQKIRTLSNEVREKDAAIQSMLKDIQQMQISTQQIISGGDEDMNTLEKCVGNVRLRDDEWYFSTYAHVGIHKQMLSDNVRTISYKQAIEQNADSLKGRTVLDLGCGTGILSMFAASAGAGRVIGIDQSDIIYNAMDIVRENNLSDKIQLLKGRLEDTELPIKEVDVIVSEWMGYFLLYEGMLDSVIYARDHHLAKGGLLLPNRCSISLVGLGDIEQHTNSVGFWNDVHGYRMNCLRQQVLEEPIDLVVDNSKVVTSPSIILTLDLYTCTSSNLDFAAEFTLEVSRDDVLTALVGYFDIFFDLPSPISFSTGPHVAPTHWKQTLFLLEEPINVKQGETVTGKLVCRRYMEAVRSLTVAVEICGKKYKYSFD